MSKIFCVLITISIVYGCAAQVKTFSWDLRPAFRTGYGYTADDPIRMGYSRNRQENISFCKQYIANLRTLDEKSLEIVSRFAVGDPKHKPKGIVGGILDLYVLAPIDGIDTFRLYFDIYHKDSLFVPKGLNFVSSPRTTI